MKNWKIGTRITTGFALVIALALALGIFAYSRVGRLEEPPAKIAENAVSGVLSGQAAVLLPTMAFFKVRGGAAIAPPKGRASFANIHRRLAAAALAPLDRAVRSAGTSIAPDNYTYTPASRDDEAAIGETQR